MQKNPSIKAMIVGSAGQDGYYLGRSLLRDGVEIVGITRSGVLLPCETKIRPFCLLDPDSVSSLVKEVKPEQIRHVKRNNTTFVTHVFFRFSFSLLV